MICPKCKKEPPPTALYCPWCGSSLAEGVDTTQNRKTRGNGTGSVYRRGDRWIAVVTLGYEPVGEFPDNKLLRKTRSKTFRTKKEAVAALPALRYAQKKEELTLQQLFDRWLPTHKAGKSTLDCYKAAIKHFSPLRFAKLDAITIDDLQDCIDECGHGRRTQENMRAALGLAYKYGIPRHLIPSDLNLAHYLKVGGEAAAKRDSFTDVQIERIRQTGTFETDTVLCMIYLGFRPSEFLELTSDSYDSRGYFTGGAKTEAGRDRLVTVSPKILPIILKRVENGGYIAGKKWDLKAFTEEVFYLALDQAGIENPIVTVAGGVTRHKYTPHTCRHTFATLMKRASGTDKDKLALIGHANDAQLRDYQDVHLEDLKRITDAI